MVVQLTEHVVAMQLQGDEPCVAVLWLGVVSWVEGLTASCTKGGESATIERPLSTAVVTTELAWHLRSIRGSEETSFGRHFFFSSTPFFLSTRFLNLLYIFCTATLPIFFMLVHGVSS